MNAPLPPSRASSSGGLPLAIGAYLLWGLFPFYIKWLQVLPPLELVGWRIVLALPVCLVMVAVMRQGAALRAALRDRRRLSMLVASSLLICGNWLTYVMAVHANHMYAASIGYYINPLVNFVLGTVFLKERLRRLQWLAVGIAGVGVALLAWDARDTLWISLALAGTFGGYGLVRKLAPVDALPGLTVETLVLVPVAGLLIYAGGGQPVALSHGGAVMALTACAGAVTAVPLLLFAGAARRLDLSTLGFVQFLSPTIVFLQGLWVFHEPLRPGQLACLGVIWVAIGVFCWDLARAGRRSISPVEDDQHKDSVSR